MAGSRRGSGRAKLVGLTVREVVLLSTWVGQTHPSIHPSTNPAIHPLTYALIHASDHQPIHSSTHPFIHPTTHPFIHLPPSLPSFLPSFLPLSLPPPSLLSFFLFLSFFN